MTTDDDGLSASADRGAKKVVRELPNAEKFAGEKRCCVVYVLPLSPHDRC